MHSTRRTGSRRAVLAGLFLALGLVSASPVAAYPTTPEGEPLYLEQSVPVAATPVGGTMPRPAGAAQQTPTPGSATEAVYASSGTDWAGVAVVAGVSVSLGLAALALIAVGSLLTSRRRSARAH
jgi:hypothetical protein